MRLPGTYAYGGAQSLLHMGVKVQIWPYVLLYTLLHDGTKLGPQNVPIPSAMTWQLISLLQEATDFQLTVGVPPPAYFLFSPMSCQTNS